MDKQQIILGLSLIVLLSCWQKGQNESNRDDFYTNRGGWDYARLPLVQPYEAMNTAPQDVGEWNITFHTELKNNAATNVKSVSIIDSVIFIQCGDSTLFKYQYVKSAWYIIGLKKKIEKGFLNEDELKTYISQNNLPTPKWYTMDSLAQIFSNDRKLPWQ
jgi:hypothetical protein